MTMKVPILIAFFLYPSPIFGGKERISPSLLKKIEAGKPGDTWNLMVEFKKSSSSVASIESESQQPVEYMKRMEEQAQQSQDGVMKRIVPIFKGRQASRSNKLEDMRTYLSLWMTNKLSIPYATADLIFSLGDDTPENSNITLIRDELVFKEIPPPKPVKPTATARQGGSPEIPWGIKTTGALDWWAAGFNGTGVIVGNIDTGADVGHPELKETWVGKDGGWKDIFLRTAFPYDSDVPSEAAAEKGHGYHGTHTVGTSVGTGVGMAPGARWISCHAGVTGASLFEGTLLGCGEFMFCPNPKEGCSYRPDVVSNSWGGDPKLLAAAGASDWYSKVIKKWRDSGIIPVFAAGNEGKDGCNTIGSPGDYEDVITVGATGPESSFPSVANFSSRGPPEHKYKDWEAKNLFKPDLVAPGTGINSAIRGGKYQPKDGTSMAAPHVAGAIALLISRNRGLSYDKIKEILFNNTRKTNFYYFDKTPHICGKDSNYKNIFPNQKAGHGALILPDPNPQTSSLPPPEPPTRVMPPPPDFTGFEKHLEFIARFIGGSNLATNPPGLVILLIGALIMVLM